MKESAVLTDIPIIDLPLQASTVALSDSSQFYACSNLISKAAASVYDSSHFSQQHPGRTRIAYLTLATPDYDMGLRVLVRSLRRVTDIPIIVLMTSRWDVQSDAKDVFGLVVPQLTRDDPKRSRQEFGATYTKLWAFGLLDFERVVFLDSDCLVLKALDALWTGDQMKVCRDSVEHVRLAKFNSGLIAFNPQKAYLDKIATDGPTADSDDGGDQGLLNSLFRNEVAYIESEYNLIKHYWYFRSPEIRASSARCIHFIVKKPWDLWFQEITDSFTVDLEDKWTSFLTHEELLTLVSHWRRRQFVAERSRFDVTRLNRAHARDRRWKRARLVGLLALPSLLIGTFLLGRLSV